MKALPLTTRAQANTLRAKLNAAAGLPLDAVLLGTGGVPMPLALCRTTQAVPLDELEDGTFEAPIPPELEARLSAGERTRLRAPTARAVPALEAARVEAPLAEEPSAPSPR